MIIWPGLRRLFRLGRAQDVEREVDDELRFHFDLTVKELTALGLSEREARAEAERKFGDVKLTKERLAAIDRERLGKERRTEWWDALFQDLRYAARGLRLKPGFTAGVVITLGLGIGANATMFGIVDRLLFRPPAYLASPDRVHRVFAFRTFENVERPTPNQPYRRYLDFRQMTSSFDVMAAYIDPSLAVGTGESSHEEHVLGVSADYWRFFDMNPVVGRFFTPDEDKEPSGTPVAVLGYTFWRSQYAGRRDVVGTTLRIGRRDYTIIGVAPRDFMGTSMGAAAAILPITAALSDGGTDPKMLQCYCWSWPTVFARRKPGVTLAAANADLTNAFQKSYAQQRIEQPRSAPAEKVHPRAVAAPVLMDRGPRSPDDSRGGTARVALWLIGVAAIVLIIACANVGNLLLARAFARRREIAVRLALGISRKRLLAQLLTESLLLALLGAAAGLAVAQWGGGLLRGTLLPDVDWTSTLADPRVILFAVAAALAAGILAGLAPALHAGRADVAAALKAGVREGTYHRSKTRNFLLVVQGALSVVLLVGAGLFVLSFHNVRAMRLGYDTDQLMWVNTIMRGVDLDSAATAALKDRLAQRALTVPGVEKSARAISVPFYTSWEFNLVVPGLDTAYLNHIGKGDILLQGVTPDYFETMGTRILRGRGINALDRAGAPLAIVVSQSLARALWPTLDPLGQCIKLQADSAPCRNVVGVAEDIRHSDFRDDPALTYYIPLVQFRIGVGGLFVRTRGDATALTDAVRRALQRDMPGSSYVTVRPLADIIAPEMRQWELGATMFTIFGGLALLVAAVGLYSVVSYGVAQRTHELGVRVALGAQTRDVVRLVLGEGLRLAVIAVVIGTAIAVLAGRWVAPLLFDTSPRDPAILAGVALVLVAISAAASAIPARRASRVDPNIALRAD
jgi:predicted permease